MLITTSWTHLRNRDLFLNYSAGKCEDDKEIGDSKIDLQNDQQNDFKNEVKWKEN